MRISDWSSDVCSSDLQKSATRSIAAGSVPSGGVRMHQRPWNSEAKPDSGPLCSVPATGCAGTITDSGSASRSAVATPSLQLPTSATFEPAGSAQSYVAEAAPTTPTGTHNQTHPVTATPPPPHK